MTMEKGQALILAAKILDRPGVERDSELAILARQLLRSEEEIGWLQHDFADYMVERHREAWRLE